ncbi:MAG: hypothetical protein ABIP55_12850 [Tepidisphaeraceae bacterium]
MSSLRPLSIGFFAVIASLALASPSRGASVLFDLENQAVSADDALAALTLSNSEVNVSITREGGAMFGVSDLSASSGTVAFGARSLKSIGAGAYVIDFSTPVNSFSAVVGDFAEDTDDLSLRAFTGPGGTGTEVDFAEDALVPVEGTFTFRTLFVEGSGIQSALLSGGENDNSSFADNFGVTTAGATPIPLPAAAFTFPLVAAAAVFAARKLRVA